MNVGSINKKLKLHTRLTVDIERGGIDRVSSNYYTQALLLDDYVLWTVGG